MEANFKINIFVPILKTVFYMPNNNELMSQTAIPETLPTVSVDCVIFGYDEEKLKVLIRREFVRVRAILVLSGNCQETMSVEMKRFAKRLHVY